MAIKRKMKDIGKRRFVFEELVEGLNAAVLQVGLDDTKRALVKLKFAVIAHAWTEMSLWHESTDKEQAIAWAWEDAAIALCGYGTSSLTGPLVEMWTSVPKEKRPEFGKGLDEALSRAEKATSKVVPRRYLPIYRQLKARRPADGFDLPAIVPTFGTRFREWAADNGLDPDRAEYQMRKIEELERMGLTDVKDKAFLSLPDGELEVEANPRDEEEEGDTNVLTFPGGGR
jgi:hypothetical protein